MGGVGWSNSWRKLPLGGVGWSMALAIWLGETAATEVATTAESAETVISLTVLVETLAFSVPEAGLGDASTALMGAISCVSV